MDHRRIWIGWLLMLLAAPVLAGPAEKKGGPIGPEAEDEWFVVELQGQPCGHMHSTMRTVGEEVHSRNLIVVGIARGPATIKIEAEQRYRETLDGRPLGFESVMTMGQMPIRQKGTVKGGRVTLESEQMGARRTNEYDFDEEVKFTWGLLQEQRRRGIKPGMSFTVKIYEPSIRMDSPVAVKLTVGQREAVDVGGKKRELYRVTSEMQLPVPVQSLSWVDEDARPVVSMLNMGMFQFRIASATREQALAASGGEGQGAELPEMFFSTLVHADQKVPAKARSVVMRLKVPADGDPLPDLPDTEMQKFRRMNPHEGRLTIKRLPWKQLKGAGSAKGVDKPIEEASEAELAEYLRASTMLDIDDKRIGRLAKQAVKGAASPGEKADALRKFVTRYVKNKNLDVAFATASEVAKTRTGDCSEHAVLLAALARAAGLPARGVSGIVQVPWAELPEGAQSAFGYHMWTQVYFGGQWVDIDAAMRQTDCDPTHIALALMPLNDEGMVESVMSLLPLIGRLEIEIEKVESPE